MTTDSILEMGLLAVVLSSFWMVFVLTIRTAVARWLGARWAYYLWLVPLIGLLAMGVPTRSVQRILDVPGIEVPVVNGVIDSASRMFAYKVNPAQASATRIPKISRSELTELLLISWLLGTLLTLLHFSVRNFQYSKKVRLSSRSLTCQQESLIQTHCPNLVGKSSQAIRKLPSGCGPAVVGLLRPVLYLPADFFQRYTAQQQALILEHEHQHLRRHDLIGLLFARVFRCLFWFNPLVYVAEWYLQLDQELSVDEKVLVTKNRASRRLYGESLLLSARTGVSFTQVNYSPSFGHIKQRTYMLKHYRQHLLGSLLGGFLLTISVSVSVAYGVLGALELEPDLKIREALRLPMTTTLSELESGATDDVLAAMLVKLKRLETAFPDRPLSDNELAQLTDLLALVYYQTGELDHSIKLYEKVVSLADEMPEHQSRALNSIAKIHFAQENYVETIRALVQSEDISPAEHLAESWALRSRAFVKLQQWQRGLRYINHAIAQSEAYGEVPRRNWLLSQTALEWKVGDLASAARSLEKSLELFPGTSYENKLVVFNELVQEVWEPVVPEESLAQF